jgi:hypothetical protein
MSLAISKGRTFVNAEKITPTKINDAFDAATITGAGTMAEQDASAVNISGGNAALSVLAVQRLTQNLELGYPTSGAIPLNLSNATSAYIALAGNATFSLVGLAAGFEHNVTLKNASAGSITLTWPAWSTPVGITLPTTLNAGEFLVLRLRCHGTTAATVVASYN